MNRFWYGCVGLVCLFYFSTVLAGEVQILKVEMERQGATWLVNVTIKHEDTGWEHYADAWRVVGSKGEIYGQRTLAHPHVTDMPFTRSLAGVAIADGVTSVWVEAHDNKHGWSNDRVSVDLTVPKGDRFEVRQFSPGSVGTTP